jgi:outer membrane immunogenic protein
VAPVWVVGLEADYGWGNNKSTLASRIPGLGVLNGGSFTEVKGKWDASLRARAGVLVTPTLLAYATGGLAYQRIEAIATCPADTTVCNPAVGTQSFSNSSNRVGWTVGGGLEAMLAPNWLARVEYRYSDFDTFSFTAIPFSVSTFGANADLSTKTHIVTGGLAYKFDWGAPVVAKY